MRNMVNFSYIFCASTFSSRKMTEFCLSFYDYIKKNTQKGTEKALHIAHLFHVQTSFGWEAFLWTTFSLWRREKSVHI